MNVYSQNDPFQGIAEVQVIYSAADKIYNYTVCINLQCNIADFIMWMYSPRNTCR